MAGQNEFTPFNRWRLLTHYERILALKSGHIPSPRMAIIYPSYNCNQDCRYCFYAEERTQFKGVMYTLDQFKYVLRKLHELGVKGVEYCGGGDPFTNPHLVEATRGAIKQGMKFGVLTNGTMLNSDAMELVRSHFSYIRVSVDSFNRERYLAKRRPHNPAQYDTMRAKLIELGTRRSEKNNLYVGVKLLLDKDNITNIELDIKEALTLCAAWNIDSLQIKVAERQDDPANQVFSLQENIDRLIEENRDRYKFNIQAGTKKIRIKEQCWLNPVQLTVDPLGDVYLCCYYQHRKESHKLCNIFTEDLFSIWGSKKHKEKIKGIKVSECNVWNCRFHGYHEIANAIIDDCMQLQFS